MENAALLPLIVLAALTGCTLPSVGSGAEAAGTSSFLQPEGVDHVLLWTREVEQDTSVLTERLGFNVVEGGTFSNNIANRLALFRDQSFLEILYFTIPFEQMDADAIKGVEFLAQRDGSVGFGIRTEDLDKAAARVASAGLPIDRLSPGDYDPDGPEGPLTEAAVQYRTFGFEDAPMPGLDPFFVWYSPSSPRTAEGEVRWASRTTHENTASRLTSVWIVTANPEASSTALAKMGFSPGPPIRLSHLNATGTVFTGGRSAILLVKPQGWGVAQKSLELRGPHVLGVSIEVDSLEAARRTVSRGYGRAVPTYRSAFGSAVFAPSQEDLGIFVEFHAAPTSN